MSELEWETDLAAEQDESAPGISYRELVNGVDPGPRVRYDAVNWEDQLVPGAVDRYLMPHERRVIVTHLHWIRLLLPAVIFTAGLAGAVTLNSWLYETHHATAFPVRVIWVTWGAAALWSIIKWIEWRATWFAVTSQRLILITGAVRRDVTSLPLGKVRDVELTQTGLGQLAGYGTLRCPSIATDHALHNVGYLPWPIELYGRIWRLLEPPDGRPGPRKDW